MPHKPYVLAVTLVALFAVLTVHAAEGEPADPLEASARRLVRQMAAGEFDDAGRDFDRRMASALPPARLEATWQTLQAQAGPFQEIAGVRTQPAGGLTAVFVTCKFRNAYLDAKVVFNPDGKIGGLWFQPGAPPGADALPDYVVKEAFSETEVVVGEGEWALPATVSMPKGDSPFPGLVLVHGSGPQDRDETVGAVRPFRDLAWGLASSGVAVLRYEKRTKAHAAKLIEQLAGLTAREEVVDDALAAVALLRGTDGVDPARVFVLGHSWGGSMIPRIAAEDAQIAGFVIMAGATRPTERMMLEQIRYITGLDGRVSPEEEKALADLQEAAARIAALTPEDAGSSELILGGAPAYWLDLRGYDPAAAAATVDRPMLVLHGGRDYQVTTEDYHAWQAALADRADVTFKLYPSLNHLFVEGEGPSMPSEYDRPGHVAAEVVRDLAAWIQACAPVAPPPAL
jgi:dienelactone hydrolase